MRHSPTTLFLDHLAGPIGAMLIVHDEVGAIRALDFDDHEPRMNRLLGRHYGAAGEDFILREAPAPASIAKLIAAYFAGDLHALGDIEVATSGTPFQRDVWAALREIPPGTAISYGALAKRIGRPKAVRAVGLANGANPIGIVVPCHRVIGADSSLTGYGGGLERKQWLLSHEGVALKHRVERRAA